MNDWTNEEVKLLASGLSNKEVAERTGRTEPAIRGKRQRLAAEASTMDLMKKSIQFGLDKEPLRVEDPKENFTHATKPIEFGRIPLEILDGDEWTNIGLVADTHLCCKESRLDALHAQYDLFEKEGIRDVYHAGNIVDGYIPKINGGSVFETGIDGQAAYCVEHYPRRKGVTTHFITGNDHEGWWQKEGFNFGAYLEFIAQQSGRNDLHYIGHVEADVELVVPGRDLPRRQFMKIQHPGGGSAYARSYKGQKMVESFQGGEKPTILVMGHYHVHGYNCDRNVHIVNLPGFQDQTIFGRTKNLRYEVGGCLLSFKLSSHTGSITRLRPEFNLFYDRGFYKPFLRSDSILIKGRQQLITGKQ